MKRDQDRIGSDALRHRASPHGISEAGEVVSLVAQGSLDGVMLAAGEAPVDFSISEVEPNIHAGVKYIRFTMNHDGVRIYPLRSTRTIVNSRRSWTR
jgi:hypothetical protein